jgi:eukaryotic-like serine/threonine-protein kinase
VNSARWKQINDLFHAALEHDAAARDAFLRGAAGEDEALLREVQSLLASHRRSREFLDQPAWGIAADLILDDDGPRSLVGQRIGSYHVVEEIGRGGMGVVYAAEDERLNRTVALKALTPEYTRDATRRERLIREARAAAALSHPAIATIFALEEIEGNLYIASELVRGRTLRDELRDGPLPPAQLQPVLVAIAEALVVAHQRGIVHRDLKPENIIRRDDGQIKVLDFGIARSPTAESPTATKLTQAGVALGTPGYMAPEQFSGADVDARTDQFAFGVVAWELATGEHPFGTDPASVIARMTELMDGRTAGLSRALPLPGLDRIVRRCMRAAPAQRYASAEALLADLRALESSSSRQPMRGDTLWWWQFHQIAIAVVNSLMPVAMWTIRPWIDPRYYGSILFLIALAVATVSVTLRLHLYFTSRVHPSLLVEQRNQSFSAIVFADAVLAVLLLVAASLIAGAHDALSALFLSVAVVVLASLGLIEPATTRAAGLKA